jgi:hypothetical protein
LRRCHELLLDGRSRPRSGDREKYLSPEPAQKLALRDIAAAKTDELSTRE